MKLPFKLLPIFFLSVGLSACSSYFVKQDNTRLCATENGEFYQCQDMVLTNKIIEQDSNSYTSATHFIKLNEYTQQMAMDLKADLENTELKGSIVVASFVYHDETLQQTNVLGRELAEYFINDLQNIGLQVSDINVTGTINRTGNGDFAFSKQQDDFFRGTNVGYVLTGTMIKTAGGIMVNSRIIGLNNKQVVASSTKAIPNLLIGTML